MLQCVLEWLAYNDNDIHRICLGKYCERFLFIAMVDAYIVCDILQFNCHYNHTTLYHSHAGMLYNDIAVQQAISVDISSSPVVRHSVLNLQTY